MKTKEILGESVTRLIEIELDFDDLSAIQIAALRAIADGRLDFDNASERMMDVVYELQNFNLVDETFELTDTGKKAVKLALKYGSAERRRAAAKKNVRPPNDDVYDDDYGSSTYDDEDDMSVYDHNKFGSPDQRG